MHLDTLDRERFRQITRRDDLDKVLAGIAAAQRLGFGPIKLNAVAVKNLVEPDIVPLARFGRENGFEVRFIEFMPLDAQQLWDRGKVLLAGDIIEILSREIAPLIPIPDADPRAPALEYRFADGIGRVGFIASVSRPFCRNCNRLRLTADGKLRYCLFAIEEDDVKGMLRGGATDAGDCGADSPQRGGQVGRARDQYIAVRGAAAADVRDRGVDEARSHPVSSPTQGALADTTHR